MYKIIYEIANNIEELLVVFSFIGAPKSMSYLSNPFVTHNKKAIVFCIFEQD